MWIKSGNHGYKIVGFAREQNFDNFQKIALYESQIMSMDISVFLVSFIMNTIFEHLQKIT